MTHWPAPPECDGTLTGHLEPVREEKRELEMEKTNPGGSSQPKFWQLRGCAGVKGCLGVPGRWCWVTRAVSGVAVSPMSPDVTQGDAASAVASGELSLIHTKVTSAAEPAVPYQGAECPAPPHKRQRGLSHRVTC